MDFREEYKKQAEVMTPSAEAMERMTKNIMEQVNAPVKKAIPFRKISYIGGAVAACAVITVGAVKLLPSMQSELATADTAAVAESSVYMYQDAAVADEEEFTPVNGIQSEADSDNTKLEYALGDSAATSPDTDAVYDEAMDAAEDTAVISPIISENDDIALPSDKTFAEGAPTEAVENTAPEEVMEEAEAAVECATEESLIVETTDFVIEASDEIYECESIDEGFVYETIEDDAGTVITEDVPAKDAIFGSGYTDNTAIFLNSELTEMRIKDDTTGSSALYCLFSRTLTLPHDDYESRTLINEYGGGQYTVINCDGQIFLCDPDGNNLGLFVHATSDIIDIWENEFTSEPITSNFMTGNSQLYISEDRTWCRMRDYDWSCEGYFILDESCTAPPEDIGEPSQMIGRVNPLDGGWYPLALLNDSLYIFNENGDFVGKYTRTYDESFPENTEASDVHRIENIAIVVAEDENSFYIGDTEYIRLPSDATIVFPDECNISHYMTDDGEEYSVGDFGDVVILTHTLSDRHGEMCGIYSTTDKYDDIVKTQN